MKEKTMKTNPTYPSERLKRIWKQTSRFRQRQAAFDFANGAAKPLGVMLGDDGRFWVTTPANCARLEKMGYEWAD